MSRIVALLLTLCVSICHAGSERVQIDYGQVRLNGNLNMVSEQGMQDGVIVVLHGTLGHKDMEIIAGLQEVFAENHRNTLAINLSLGQDNREGFFACENLHDHRLQDANTELGLWISWLKEQGVGEVTLLGHSRGANQIARFASDHQTQFGKVVLLAPPTGFASVNAEREKIIASAVPGGWLTDIEFLHCSDAKVSVNSYLSYYASASLADTPLLLNDIHSPVLVFAGSEDQVVPNLPDRMDQIEKDNIRFVLVDGADHFFRDLYLYDIVETSIEFLDD